MPRRVVDLDVSFGKDGEDSPLAMGNHLSCSLTSKS